MSTTEIQTGCELERKLIEQVEGSSHLAVGVCEDYSEKAWWFYQPHRADDSDDPGGYLPKSQVVVFETVGPLSSLNGPQSGLADFEG